MNLVDEMRTAATEIALGFWGRDVAVDLLTRGANAISARNGEGEAPEDDGSISPVLESFRQRTSQPEAPQEKCVIHDPLVKGVCPDCGHVQCDGSCDWGAPHGGPCRVPAPIHPVDEPQPVAQRFTADERAFLKYIKDWRSDSLTPNQREVLRSMLSSASPAPSES